MMEKDFKFTPREPRQERDRTPSADSLRRMGEGGRKGGRAGRGVPRSNRGIEDSKFDAVLDAFIAGPHELVKVLGATGYSFTRSLNLRIWARELKGIKASTVNDEVYLEKL